MPTIINGTTGITTDGINATSGNTSLTTLNVASNAISAVNGINFRNRIINGDMAINQRGGTITPSAGGTYGIDRFYGYASGGGVFTAVQSTDVPAGSGFVNSNLLTVTTPDSSIGSTDYYSTGQFIEGNNIADLMWGTANARPVTLSFWVRSSVTGSYSAAFYNSDATRNYPATFTISAANTWQQVVLTIPGPTDGTWLTNNGIGITLRIDLGSGSSFNGTANTWNAAGAFVGIRTSGNVNWIATNGATFAYTGVQLEAGSVATPFERLPYSTELMLCQRYYWKTLPNSYTRFGMVDCVGGTTADAVIPLPVTMRTMPSLTTTGTAGNYVIYTRQVLVALTTIPAIDGVGSTPDIVVISCTSSTGWTQGSAGQFVANNNAGVFLGFSAEL